MPKRQQASTGQKRRISKIVTGYENLASALEHDVLHKLTHPFAKLTEGVSGELIVEAGADAA